jgi:hypothetical protein
MSTVEIRLHALGGTEGQFFWEPALRGQFLTQLPG